MKKTLMVMMFLFTYLFFSVSVFGAEKVAWFKSGGNSKFWPVVESIMEFTAKDLGMELQVHEFNNDPVYLIELVNKVIENPETKPDCILIHNFKNRGEKVLSIAAEFDIPVFFFNAGFKQNSDVGQPRGKYPNWIGLMVPDDEYAGYLLAKELIARAKKMEVNSSGIIQMVALEGNRTSEASNKRVAGLKRALAEHPEVINNQFFHTKWKSDQAKEVFLVTRRRYPETTLFWAASESMAIGVIDGAKELGLTPGRDFITGGVDLLPEHKQYLENGDMAVSVGGHYFEGAWVLVLIHDYFNGIDFGDEGGFSYTTKMIPQTKDNFTKLSDIYSALSEESLSTFDFTKLSKTHNPQITKYDFDLEIFLK